jgi:hypothetical protein
MTNAKQELLSHLAGLQDMKGRFIPIKCAIIRTDRNSYWDDNDNYVQPEPILLKEGYSADEYTEFLDKLNFEYDDGYGGQELYGMIWLMEDNTWYERGEYDGSEWWEYKECPQIPNDLKVG